MMADMISGRETDHRMPWLRLLHLRCLLSSLRDRVKVHSRKHRLRRLFAQWYRREGLIQDAGRQTTQTGFAC